MIGNFERTEGRPAQVVDKNFLKVKQWATFVRQTVMTFVDATSAAVTVTLPDQPERDYFYVKTDSSANAVTVAASPGSTIEGASDVTLSAQYDKVFLTYNAGVWYIVSQ